MSAAPSPPTHIPPPLPAARAITASPADALTPRPAAASSGPHPAPHAGHPNPGQINPGQINPGPSSAPHPGPARRAQSPSRRIGAASALWVVLAVAAVGYLSLVVLRPDLLATHLPQGPQPGPAEPNGTRASVTAMAEVQELHTTVAELRNELASVKRDIEASDARSRRLVDQLATLQGLPPSETGTLPAPQLRLDSAPVIAPRAEVKPAPAAQPVQTAKVLNETKAPATIETGSVKPAPAVDAPLFETAIVKPAPKTLALQIASGSSLDSLRLSWNLLSETHAGSLKNLEPRYSTGVDANGLVYNLMAGPVKTEAEAMKMCKDLAAKAIPCKVVGDFDGPSL